jgi:multidrug efflux pump
MSNEQGTARKVREFALSTLSVDNRTSVFVLAFLILFMGITAYQSMPKESFPEITQPTIYVGLMYPGNSPVDMENLVTRPIEKEINTISGIDNISSTSVEGYSTIVVEFNLDEDVSQALQEVKDAVDRAKQELPSDLDEDPNIFELDFSEMPIMFVNLYGDMDFEVLREYAEYLEDEIEKVDAISGVDLRGVLEREVSINVDPHAMAARGVSFYDLQQAVAQENVTMFAGNLLTDGFRRNIRLEGEFDDPQRIEQIIVSHERGKPVYVGDFADVRFGYIEPTSYARLNGDPVIILEVKKQSGGNLIDAAREINAIIDRAREEVLPPQLNIVVTNDQSTQTEQMVENLENNIISGVILVVLVLLFFLGLRNAAFVGIAIPLSMLMGIAILHFSGVTLNMMVLFSLILALGMLVDNGIVVVENIYRHMEMGKNRVRAAKEGVGEVAWPIIASTATTLAAFLPLVFWNSLMGEFMKYLPITLIIVLGSSLFVALVINPVLTAVFMKIDEPGSRRRSARFFYVSSLVLVLLALVGYFGLKNNTLGSFLLATVLLSALNRWVLIPLSRRFQDVFLPRLERAYHKVISFALAGPRPFLMLGGTVVLLVVSLGIFGASQPNVALFPDNFPTYVNVFIELPLGTDIAETNAYTARVEDKITRLLDEGEDNGVPYIDVVEAITTQVGEGTADPNEGPAGGSTSPHKARINISFIPFDEREGASTQRIMSDIQDLVAEVPGGRITVAKDPAGPPVGYPINVEVSGPDVDRLIYEAGKLRSAMVAANIPGIEELKLDLETGKPQIEVNLDRHAARRYGTSSQAVLGDLNAALFGREISKYKEGEDDFPIVMRFDTAYRYDLNALMNLRVTFKDQTSGTTKQIPVSALATLDYSSTYGSVKRQDLQRVITVFSNVKQGYNATAIVEEMKQALDGYEMPPGYTFKFTGEQEEQEESAAFLSTALLVAVGLILLIIVSQFNSVVVPVIIMMTVLFSTIGVFLGITVFRMDFIILMMMIGIISLAGIVVNNAIVLVDYINLLRHERREELELLAHESLPRQDLIEVIVRAGETRLRPVLLTAITTVLGLIPLALGININFFTLLSDFDPEFYIGGDSVVFWGPMAWTVIFGLTFATFLTLVIVPVMYYLFDRGQKAVYRILATSPLDDPAAGGAPSRPVPADNEG